MWAERVKNFKIGSYIVLSSCPLPLMYDSYAHWVHKALSSIEFICALNGTRAVINVPDEHSRKVLDYHKKLSKHFELISIRVDSGLTADEKTMTDRNFTSMVIRPENDPNIK